MKSSKGAGGAAKDAVRRSSLALLGYSHVRPTLESGRLAGSRSRVMYGLLIYPVLEIGLIGATCVLLSG